MKRKNWPHLLLSFLFLVTLIGVIKLSPLLVKEGRAQTDDQSDAIGIRIIPNPNHLSISRWYESQGFTGSPQALTVDGYEAIRDGRTVYINTAQILPDSKTIYTNIYLISYNQDQSKLTTDILGQIIAHWKFNDNIDAEISTCGISAVKCSSDIDCPSTQSCNLSSGTCQLAEEKACQIDDDCPSNYFCNSLKSKVIRDLGRIGRIGELEEALARYRDRNGHYPLLSSGSYLPGVSTSLWPSWEDNFLNNLELGRAFVDPVNRLGACPGYDTKTCWDKDRQSFVYPKENLTMKLPDDSYALVYTTNDAGSEYNLCAVMETRDQNNPALGYRLEPNDPASSNCVTALGIVTGGDISNQAPRILDMVLTGITGKEFNGFVLASDPENDPLTWQIILGGSYASWSEQPYIKGTSDPNQKKIFAQQAGSPGSYPIIITVTDSKGASTSEEAIIQIREPNTLAEASEYTYRLNPVNPFNYSFYVAGGTLSPQSRYSLVFQPGTEPNSQVDILKLDGIKEEITDDGINRIRVNYKGVISTNTGRKFNEDLKATYAVYSNIEGVNTEINRFTIKLTVDRPSLSFNCSSQVRASYPYTCEVGLNRQGDNTVSYSVDGLPPGMRFGPGGEGEDVFPYVISGISEIVPDEPYQITVQAVNQYGTKSSRTFSLGVNNYCGDGKVQTPNTEGMGGMLNNGFEFCDGSANVATSISGSNRYMQYACTTTGTTNYPISSYDQCVFRSPLDGGGYCGDSYCQAKIPGLSEGENKNNCPFDCDPKYDISQTLPPGENIGSGSSIVFGDKFIVKEDTAAVYFREGDKISGSSIQMLDNPDCADGTSYRYYSQPTTVGCKNTKQSRNSEWCQQFDLCPAGYSEQRLVAIIPGGDLCRMREKKITTHVDSISPYKTVNYDIFHLWGRRYVYQCVKTEEVERYIGMPCRVKQDIYNMYYKYDDTALKSLFSSKQAIWKEIKEEGIFGMINGVPTCVPSDFDYSRY